MESTITDEQIAAMRQRAMDAVTGDGTVDPVVAQLVADVRVLASEVDRLIAENAAYTAAWLKAVVLPPGFKAQETSGRIAELETCTAMSASGANGEMLRCGFIPGHEGDHAWASLPTFFGGVAQPTAAQAAGGERALTRVMAELRGAREEQDRLRNLLAAYSTNSNLAEWWPPSDVQASKRRITALEAENKQLRATIAQWQRSSQDVPKMRAVVEVAEEIMHNWDQMSIMLTPSIDRLRTALDNLKS